MTNFGLDLSGYSGLFAEYKPLIAASPTFEEASRTACRFLTEADDRFGVNATRTFSREADYLWTTFPNRAKTLTKYKRLVELLLGQAVDCVWYDQHPGYQTKNDVKRDGSLLSFKRHNEDFEVRFVYVQYHPHVLMRIPNSLRLRYRRAINHPGRYTQGLTTTSCTRALAGLINQVSENVAASLDRRKRLRLLVNSVLRTVEYQDSLARIGYVAPRYSGHVAGYAFDLEKRWYAEYDPKAHSAMQNVLSALYQSGTVNLIDEGSHWHICLNPGAISSYEARAEQWVRGK